MSCPVFDDLLAARTDPARHGGTLAHVARCAECARTWSALLRLDEGPAAARWGDVPERLSRAARELPLRPARVPPRIAARLRHDSAAEATRPALALRGAGPAARHLRYDADGLQLALAVLAAEDAGGDTLVGHVDGLRETFTATCVLTGAQSARWTPLEDNGDFRFERVAPGAWILSVETDDQHLVLPPLELAAPGARDPLR